MTYWVNNKKIHIFIIFILLLQNGRCQCTKCNANLHVHVCLFVWDDFSGKSSHFFLACR